MLIVEGTRLSGKRMLVEKLSKHTFFQDNGYVCQHLKSLPSKFSCQRYVDLTSRRTIWDGFHLSGAVRSAVKSEDTILYPEAYRWIDAHLRLLGSLTVIITVDEHILKTRMRSSENVEQVIETNDKFAAIASRKDMKHVDFDFHVHCTPSRPYVENFDVSRIIDKYRKRQSLLLHITQVEFHTL